jgi:hypothetical protein
MMSVRFELPTKSYNPTYGLTQKQLFPKWKLFELRGNAVVGWGEHDVADSIKRPGCPSMI